MSVEEFAVSIEKLNVHTKQFFMKINQVFGYSFIFCFVLGIGIAYQTQNYALAIIMGGAILVSFYVSRALLAPTRQLHKHIVSIALSLFYLQYTIQTEGEFYVRFVCFIFMTALVMYEDWRVLLNFFLTSMLMNVIVISGYFNELTIEQNGFDAHLLYQEMTQSENALVLALAVSHFVLCLFITHFLKRQTIKNAKNAIYLKEQLNVEANTQLANQIANGELYMDYVLNDHDAMGKALLNMRDNLRNIQDQTEVKKWQQNGRAIISDVLIKSHGIKELADNTIDSLVKYMNAFQGGFYVIKDSESGVLLELVAHYAFDIPESTTLTYQLGEGLVGEAAKRKSTVHIKEVPDSYGNITSGLGGAKPNSILIVPLKVQEQVVGVIEISNFENYKEHEIEFMENIAERIAITINTANAKTRTNKLLEESQALNGQLQKQGEENKNDMKNLVFEREKAENLSKELQYFIHAFEVSFAIAEYDKNGQFIAFNDNFKKLSGFELGELIGKDHSHITISEEKSAVFYHGFWEEVLQGKISQGVFQRTKKSGELYWAKSYYAPLKDKDGKVTKIVHVEFDITREQQGLYRFEGRNGQLASDNKESLNSSEILHEERFSVEQQLQEMVAKYQEKCHIEEALRDELKAREAELAALGK